MIWNVQSNKGFSIIESLIAVGIVAVSILAVGAIVGQYSGMAKTSVAKQELPGINTDVLNRTRMVLLDTKDASNRSTKGICALLEPREIKPGIIPVDLVLTKTAATQADWKAAYAPEWSLRGFKTVGRGGVQFTLDPVIGKNTLVTSSAIDPKSLHVDVVVSVRTMDPEDSSGVFAMLPSGAQRVDAKKASFMLEATTRYDKILENGTREAKESLSKDLVSVLDVGSCDIRDSSGRALVLSPAGTGVGDPEGRTIYNNTEFKEVGTNAFEITMSAMEVVQGKYVSGRLSADRTKNVVSACTETRYRCPKTRETRTFRPFINLTANVNYYSRNMYGYRERARISPKLQFLDEQGNDILARYGAPVNYTNRAGINYRQHSDKLFYPLNEQGQMDFSAPMTAADGNNRILASVSNVQNMCRDVCSTTNPKSVKPELRMSTPDLLDPEKKWVDESGVASMPLHCTMCFIKGCTRMGLETFGPVEEMPPEPLDAQIPECAAQNEDEGRKILPFAEENVSTSSPSSCVAASVSNGKLIYRTRNCNDTLPVMCFAFGQYTFAKDLGSKNPRTARYDEAQTVCRNLGRESHLVEVLREGIAQQGGSVANLNRIPTSGNRFAFLNLAKVGSFVSPQSDSEQGDAVNELRKEFGSQVRSDFWVALKMENGAMIADVPRAATSNGEDEQHMLYYSPSGVQTHTIISTTPYSFVKSPHDANDTAYALFNHVKFRGVVPVSKNQMHSMEFLCLRKSNKSFFITSGRASDNFSRGGEACEAQGGLFVAPHSPTAWLQAMLLVDDHGNYFPFPELNGNPSHVWVAFENGYAPAIQGEFAALGYRKVTTEQLSNSLVDRNGSFIEVKQTQMQVEKPVEEKKDEKSGGSGGSTPQTGETTNAPKEPEYIWVDNPNVKIKVACYSMKKKSIHIRAEMPGCEEGETRLLESDLRKPIISMLWVLNKGSFNLGSLDFIKVKP